MSNYRKLAEFIVDNVGGVKNIVDLTHCMTRLRFKLKDDNLISSDNLNNNEEIISTTHAGGRFQVIVGNAVEDIYKEVEKIIGVKQVSNDKGEQKKGVLNKLTDTITKIITPTLGVLVSAGLLKGLLALLSAVGWIQAGSGTYVIINAIGDSLFYFFPIILGYTSALTFGLDKFVGMIIGASLIYPGVQEAFSSGGVIFELLTGTPLAAQAFGNFFGIPVIFPIMGYASTVIPIILINYFASKVEKLLKSKIPPIVGFAFIPFLTLLISVPIGFIVIGPIASLASNIISWSTINLFGFSPILTAIVVGLIYQPLVIFGLHWPLILLAITNFTTLGYDYLWPMMFTASFAQTAAVMAVALRTKDKKEKSMAIPATISGLMCIIEPAIYGFTLPIKKRFAFSAIGATIGGLIITIMNARMYTLAIGLLGFVGYVNPNGDMRNLYIAVFATIISMIVTFCLTYFTFNESTKTKKEFFKSINILSPVVGKIKPIEEISDKTFANEVLGKSFAIVPTEGYVLAPFDCEIVSLFPSNHAIGLKDENGIEVLVHVGIDTVNLKGDYFSSFVKQGSIVKKGEKLIEFDIKKINEAGYAADTTVIFTNHAKYDYEQYVELENATLSSSLFTVYLK
ncbi:MAG: beta-glucoside-specific PTS transporter subunit IIABC [Erysipelotrichaceae bacterium]|nr:beta-glucoside-specific PTS transporter subunit IIABC [Erysipelotrichaceae bacterium]